MLYTFSALLSVCISSGITVELHLRVWKPVIIFAMNAHAQHQPNWKFKWVFLRVKPPNCLPVGTLEHQLITEKERVLAKRKSNLMLEGALVLIRQQLVWLSLNIFTWSEWDFLIETRGERKTKSMMSPKVGLVFAYRKVKEGCAYYTSAPTQRHIFTPSVTVLTEFFFSSNNHWEQSHAPPSSSSTLSLQN